MGKKKGKGNVIHVKVTKFPKKDEGGLKQGPKQGQKKGKCRLCGSSVIAKVANDGHTYVCPECGNYGILEHQEKIAAG
ncbi:MAG: hypothetical protein WC933_01835 [Candidatus Paceibacterota bacterium]|jgi:predicted RNA-binding Zn-ribbon protein involved in translation (DUF1610 family)